jgi:hypothetical protein
VSSFGFHTSQLSAAAFDATLFAETKAGPERNCKFEVAVTPPTYLDEGIVHETVDPLIVLTKFGGAFSLWSNGLHPIE